MQLGTLTCDIKECKATCTEEREGSGWPGWGVLKGLRDPKTGAETAYLCPEHLALVGRVLNGGK